MLIKSSIWVWLSQLSLLMQHNLLLKNPNQHVTLNFSCCVIILYPVEPRWNREEEEKEEEADGGCSESRPVCGLDAPEPGHDGRLHRQRRPTPQWWSSPLAPHPTTSSPSPVLQLPHLRHRVQGCARLCEGGAGPARGERSECTGPQQEGHGQEEEEGQSSYSQGGWQAGQDQEACGG